MRYLFLVMAICFSVRTASFASGKVNYKKGLEFVVADSGKKQLTSFDEKGHVVWRYKGVYSYDLQVLKNGNILFCDEQNRRDKCSCIREITPDKKVVWEYKSPGEVYSCQRLSNGNTVIGECTTGKIVEVDKNGKVVASTNMTYKRGGHGAVRMVRKTKKGSYLAAHLSDRVVREYDSKGKVLREIKVNYPVFACKELRNGNVLAASEHAIYEFDLNSKLVWSLEQQDLPGIELHWLTNAVRLPDGNTLVCNWLGHGGLKKGNIPLFIVTPEKKIVWQFTDIKNTKWVAAAKIIKNK